MPNETKTAEQQTTMPPPGPPPEPKLPALRSGGGIAAIIPQNFDEAYKMARLIVAAGCAPKSFEMKDQTDLKPYISVERVAVAIMHGLEVGLPPMQAVQGIAVINNIPTVYGDTRDALVEASGLLEDRLEEYELDDQGLFLWWRCTVWRRGRKTPIVQEITRVQAQRAGWLKKAGPWTDSPNRMAQWRARGWAYRDAFPDVLRGLADRDEVEDMVDVTDRGSATTAPPPPRRAEYVDNDPKTGEIKDKEPAADASQAAEGQAGGDSKSEAAGQPQDQAPLPTNPWAIPESVVGQEPRRKYILQELLPKALVKVDCDAIEIQHATFIAKLGVTAKAEIVRAIDVRRGELPERLEEDGE